MRYQIQDSILVLRINLNRYKDSVMPIWFNEKCFVDENVIQISQIRIKRALPPILSLFHPREAQRETDVVSYNSVLTTNIISQQKTKYVRVHLDSVQQAKTLVLLIAVLTLKSIFHPQDFVKLVCQDQILTSEQDMQRLRRAFKLIDLDGKVSIANPQIELLQPHQGILQKRVDPYLTILRSRPRHNFRL